jgi:tripartite-type tricarboxylate transporter receptor subunit TctC
MPTRPGASRTLVRRLALGLAVALSAPLAVLLATPRAGVAQDYPAKPIRLVVPWPPGGNVDITARVIAPPLAEALGQQVVVENRGGAGGTIGTVAVARAAPDGYTLLLGSSGSVTVAPTLYRNAGYDPVRDFTAISPIQSAPMVIVAAQKTPVSSYPELVALARAKNGTLTMASAGNGSSNHFAIELLVRQSGMRLVHVPYKGSGPALNDLLGGQVETMMDQLTASMAYIREGRLKPLAVTTRTRSPQLPNVPTLAEMGLPAYEAATFTGLFGPAGLPPAVTEKLVVALRRALSAEGVRDRYRSMGTDVLTQTQAEFAAYVREDYEKWRTIAREGNISLD